MGAAELLGVAPKTKMRSAISPAEAADRRRHALVHNYWLSLKGDRPYPSIWDLDPFEIADAGPNSVMLDLSKDRENPEILVGEALRYDPQSSNDPRRQADAQSLISCVLNNYRAVLGKSGPIAFEDRCDAGDRRALECFGTLFPFSSTGQTIDYIFGLMSWQDVVEEAALDDWVGVEASTDGAAPFEAEVALSDDSLSDQAVTDDPVPEQSAADETGAASHPVANDDGVSAAAVAELAVPEDDAQSAEAVLAPAPTDEPASAQVETDAAVSREVEPCETAPDASMSDEALPDDATSDDAVPGQTPSDDPVPGVAATDDAPLDDTVSDPVSDAAPSGEAPYDEAPSDEAQAGKSLPDAVPTQVMAIGKAMFAAVRRLAVPDNVVAFASTPRESLPANDMAASAAVPVLPEAATPDAAEPADAVPGAGLSVDAGPDDAGEPTIEDADAALDTAPFNVSGSDDAVSCDTAIDEPAAGDTASNDAVPANAILVELVPQGDAPSEDAQSGEAQSEDVQSEEVVSGNAAIDEPTASEDVPAAAVPAKAVFVRMVPFAGMSEDAQSDAIADGAAIDDAADNGTPEAAVPANAVFVPIVSHAAMLEEALADEAVPDDAAPAVAQVPEPEQEFDGIEQEVTAAVVESCPDDEASSRSDEQAMPAAPVAESAASGLRSQLSVARAIASAAPDASYHSRATLYVALDHAYDFAIAAEADPDEYGKLLDEAGLEAQGGAPMRPVVELVFGPGLDGKRLADFAATLYWARRANLPAGSLASHLQFLEAGLAIVTPA